MYTRVRFAVAAAIGATLAGCYDLHGSSAPDAAGRDTSTLEIATPSDLPDAVDGGTAADDVIAMADASDGLVAVDATIDAVDVASDHIDVVGESGDAAPSGDIADVTPEAGPPPCPTGQSRCGEVCVDTVASAAHCGSCDVACPVRPNAAAACSSSRCGFLCNAGFADCDNDPSNGCEARLETVTTCGSCGTRCEGATPLCQDVMGTYRCVSGCSGAAGTRCGMSCVDPQTDLQHCGACDRACAVPMNGRATCAGGTCAIACNAGYHACGTSCADDTAVASCGSQCTPCPTRANATATCSGGTCGFTCAAGFADCDGNAANGCEVDTRTSTAHCGMCGRQCGPYNNADHACVAGACSIAMCHGATGDCNGNIADGCETALNTSAAHCGRCGNACPTRANATTTCTSGTCGFTCTTGFADCDGDASNGCEVDTRTNSSHCGMCARACAAAPSANAGCASGTCTLVCVPGFGNCDGNASNGCETETRANIDHCGACGVVCGAGTTCRSGVCAPVQRSCQGVTEGCGTTLVTGGIFEMGGRPDCGGAPSDPACVGNALIRSGVVVSSFQLDAYEVSVARFRQFWAQRPSDLPTIRSRPIAYPGGETIPWSAMASVPESQSATCNWSPTEPTRLAHPMNCIDWWAAQEFCVWDGGRLPTDAEWEYAARGRSAPQLAPGRLYPWGDAAPSTLCDRAHWVGDGCTGDDGARTRRVGSFAPSAGLYDLAGNVQEWTADRLLRTEQSPCRSLLSTDPLCLDTALPNQVVRGGDYVNPLYLLRSATRNDGNPGRTYPGVGFRCARRAPTPRPVAPLSTATTTSQRPALKVDLGGWPNARVEICRDRACTLIEEIVDVVGRQARPASALAAGVHFWRVVGRDDGVTSRPSQTWEFFVGARSAPIDTSWGSVADFNGDGRPDLAVSAPGYQSNTGRVYVYLGSPTGLGSTPSTTLTGPDGPGSGFGYNLTSVVSGGDVNGDGFADLVVSASPARSATGRVYVYHGGPSGVATTPSAVIDGPDGAGASFGGAVAGTSDFNGDGFADIVVGAPHAASQTGRVHLFLGSPSGLVPAPASSYAHPSGPGNLLGLAVASGDVNGDGLGDVLVGSLVATGSIGQARLFLGNSSAALGTPSATISAPREGAFAASTACAGDVNGDGRADMIVGAYGFHAHVYLGASSGIATMSPITFATPIALEADFGGGVAGVGDLNGDGYDDVAVRAHQANGGSGSAFIYYGSASGPPTAPSITLSGTDGASAYFSYSMAGAADFNHDGYSDIPISAYGAQSNAGRVYLFPGSATGLRTTPMLTLTGPDGAGTLFGNSVAVLPRRGRAGASS